MLFLLPILMKYVPSSWPELFANSLIPSISTWTYLPPERYFFQCPSYAISQPSISSSITVFYLKPATVCLNVHILIVCRLLDTHLTLLYPQNPTGFWCPVNAVGWWEVCWINRCVNGWTHEHTGHM